MSKKQLKVMVKALIALNEDLSNRLGEHRRVNVHNQQIIANRDEHIDDLHAQLANAPKGVSLEDIACLLHPDVRGIEKVKILRAATGCYLKEGKECYDKYFANL